MHAGGMSENAFEERERKVKSLAVIGTVLRNQGMETAAKVESLLSDYAEIITGRMGVPDKESGVNAIAVIVKGSGEAISALSGKLGRLSGVSVKSALTSIELPE